MKDESIEISNRFVIWVALLPAFLFAIGSMSLAASVFTGGKGDHDRSLKGFGKDERNRTLTSLLFAAGGVALGMAQISFARVYSSASVRNGILSIRNRGRRWDVSVEQVRAVVTCPTPSPHYPKTIRLVFDDRSPIRDAILDVSWLEEPVDTVEDLIHQAKRRAERNAQYRPAS